MKKLAGMIPPTLVRADEGKNGVCEPPPSSSIRAGTRLGLSIRVRAVRPPVATDQSGAAINMITHAAVGTAIRAARERMPDRADMAGANRPIAPPAPRTA